MVVHRGLTEVFYAVMVENAKWGVVVNLRPMAASAAVASGDVDLHETPSVDLSSIVINCIELYNITYENRL